MTRIVQQHRGTIDKYIGDAIMAFWNAPVDLTDHATRAVQTALDMQAALLQLNQEFAARGWPEVKIGVGVNTGRMSVGNMGSEFRMSYTVMGDAVNLGSRLEGITKQYGVGILVTQPTVEADPVHAFMKVDDVRVKGKETPVAIYRTAGAERRPRRTVRQDAAEFEAAFAALPGAGLGRRRSRPACPQRRARRARCTISISSASRISANRRRPPTGTACSSTPRSSHDKNSDETYRIRLQRRHWQRAPHHLPQGRRRRADRRRHRHHHARLRATAGDRSRLPHPCPSRPRAGPAAAARQRRATCAPRR